MTRPGSSARETAQFHMGAAKNLKEVLIATVGEDADLAPTLCIERPDFPAVMITPEYSDRDLTVAVMRFAAIGYGATGLALVQESYSAVKPVNPMTGSLWQPGEMQDAALHHHGLKRGLIIESLVALIITREGDATAMTAPYRRNGKKVVWLDEPDVEGGELGGMLVDGARFALRSAASFQKSKGYRETMQTAMDGLSPTKARATMDAVTTIQLVSPRPMSKSDVELPPCAVSVATQPGEYEQALTEQLGRWVDHPDLMTGADIRAARAYLS